MPWRCPVCQTEVRHSTLDEQPRLGTPYRCHVCRLELMFDRDTARMAVAPLEVDHLVEQARPRARAIPTPLTVRRKKAGAAKRKRPKAKTPRHK